MHPVSLRIWYPRIVADDSFEALLSWIKKAGIQRVYLFDGAIFADNFLLRNSVKSVKHSRSKFRRSETSTTTVDIVNRTL